MKKLLLLLSLLSMGSANAIFIANNSRDALPVTWLEGNRRYTSMITSGTAVTLSPQAHSIFIQITLFNSHTNKPEYPWIPVESDVYYFPQFKSRL